KLTRIIEPPSVGGHEETRVSPIELATIDRIVGHRNIAGNQPRNAREAVIANAKQSQVMVPSFELAIAVELVLLPVLKTLQEAVPKRGFQGKPRVGSRALGVPSGRQVEIAVIAGQLREAVQPLLRFVSGGQVYCVVALP